MYESGLHFNSFDIAHSIHLFPTEASISIPIGCVCAHSRRGFCSEKKKNILIFPEVNVSLFTAT